MKNILFALYLLMFFACQPKPAPVDVETRLKKAMSDFLYAKINNDSTTVKFTVKEVTFFADKDFYECEFRVNMKRESFDTTAMMRARIASDFSKVVRKE